ncbi:glycoside hydrolase family 2 TIM barrel-domain containing protein [Pseudoduganella umbonata]|nr:glycoside hydrolase family 2 TIM barrel-domain containing protein [Pseudoduganella umbonata]MBB3222709.1 beta-galactosidase [Pseudoduganella umbonata]
MNTRQRTVPAFLLVFLLVFLLATPFSDTLAGTPAIAAEAHAPRDPAFIRSLNGDWAFRYVPGLEAGGDAGFVAPQFDVARWDTIAVPANWELKGFAEPSYADELKEGLGLYRRTFAVPPDWRGRRTFLRFEGVAFGYEVWVNGTKAGESTASAFNRHTFDVTELLRDGGDNVLAVRVTTRPHGFEFDLNDDWSLSGIYRDVTLFSVPETHVRDLAATTKLGAGGAAELTVAVALSRPDGDVRAQLYGPDGRLAGEAALARSGEQGNAGTIRVAKPSLWTAETPSLYRLRVTVSAGGKPVHVIEERVGLREVSIANGVLLLNGRPIKMRGVNHHDLEPRHGRAITVEQMRRDIELMKKGNVNYLRTSHYPPDPRLLELCDELGMYVMDEVSIGHGEKNLEKPEYRANILARVAPTIGRDKNRPSVLVWSIGNENPITEAELEAARLAKSLDPSRPVTIPKIGSYFAANHGKIPASVELHAPHYPTNARMADYAAKLDRPTIFTEYAHALGLATDRIQDQWDIIQKHPVFAGGSIWHFMDQGILRNSAQPVDTGKPTQLVWLNEQQYFDTHGLDGADGVTYADRTPQSDFWQMRKVYAPVQIAERQAAVRPGRQLVALTVENRHDFRSLAGITLHWALRRNGKAVQQGKAAPKAPARGTETVRIPVEIPADAAGDVLALEVRAVDEAGMQVNERVVRLDLPSASLHRALDGELASPAGEALRVGETHAEFKVTAAQWILTVGRHSGNLTITDRDGRVLVAGLYPHTGRRPTMAEQLNGKEGGLWHATALTALQQAKVILTREGNGVQVEVAGRYPKPGADDEALAGGYRLDIDANGAIAVRYAFRLDHAKGTLSEAGLSIAAPASLGEFRWIGQGPHAGYPGKDRLNEFGLFHLNEADLRFRGNRRETEVAALTTAAGAGFVVAMPAGDVAVEREGGRILVSHNALIGSLGNKLTKPEVALPVAGIAEIAGTFRLYPVSPAWPAPLARWFGKPAGATDVYRPFHHSYDQ